MGYSGGGSTSGSGSTSTLPTTPSWAGGSTGSGTVQNVFDAPVTKQFGGQLVSDARAIYNQGPKPFNKSLYAGMSPTTRGGLDAILGTDTSGLTSGLGGAMDYYSSVARGEQMGMNDPNYNRVRQGVIDSTIGGVGSAFSSLGRNASDAHTRTLTNSLADSLAGMDINRLNQDYARRDAATAALPGLYQAMQLPGQTRLGVGQMLDQDAQAALTAENDRFRRINDAPFTHIANNVNLMQGGAGKDGVLTPDAPWWLSLLGMGADTVGKVAGNIKIGL